MSDRCTWPRCPCKATGQICSEREKAITQAKRKTYINPVSDKKRKELPIEQEMHEKDRLFFLVIWNEREHKCENCDAKITELALFLFHHILAKRESGGYPEYRYCRWNIWILCWQCHDTNDNGNPDNPKLKKLRAEYYRLLQLHDNGTLGNAIEAYSV